MALDRQAAVPLCDELAPVGARRPARISTIASFPAVQAMNPYQRLLYDHLRPHGFELEPDATLSLGWLLAARGRVDVLHVHWTDGLYRFGRGPAALRPAGSWAKLGLFGLRLALARAPRLPDRMDRPPGAPAREQRTRPRPRGGAAARPGGARPARPRRDVARAASRRRSDRRSPAGRRRPARLVRRRLPARPPTRAELRRELGIAEDAFVFLCFGELRSHKSWRLVVRAFRACARPDVALVLVGLARARPVREMIAAETEGDERIHVLLRYVEEEAVAELFGAADAAIVARDDGGTSGSLILPLSLGVPAVVADRPAYRELTGGETAAWLFAPGDERALTDALAAGGIRPRRGARARRRGPRAGAPPALGRRRRPDRPPASRGAGVSAAAVLDRLPLAAGMGRAAADEPAADHAPRAAAQGTRCFTSRPSHFLGRHAARLVRGPAFAPRSPGACSPPSAPRPASRW